MAAYDIPETSVSWIKLKLAGKYPEEEAGKKYGEICELYERFAEESPDIGGKDNPIVRGFIHKMFGMRAKKLNKHKADGSWRNTWGMEINPKKHKKGFAT